MQNSLVLEPTIKTEKTMKMEMAWTGSDHRPASCLQQLSKVDVWEREELPVLPSYARKYQEHCFVCVEKDTCISANMYLYAHKTQIYILIVTSVFMDAIGLHVSKFCKYLAIKYPFLVFKKDNTEDWSICSSLQSGVVGSS